jgi:hypothetical protein
MCTTSVSPGATLSTNGPVWGLPPPDRRTALASLPPASTVVVWIVSPDAIVRTGLVDAENCR